MSEQYIGEVRMVGFNFAPPGWLPCDGSLQSISNYDTLFTLIGTTYGGDGQSTFALPDLRGRVPVHQGTGFGIGQNGGAENVTLTVNQMPSHTHPLAASSGQGNAGTPAGTYFAGGPNIYAAPATLAAMGSVVASTGSSQVHANLQPYQVVNFIIATEGIFPSQS